MCTLAKRNVYQPLMMLSVQRSKHLDRLRVPKCHVACFGFCTARGGAILMEP